MSAPAKPLTLRSFFEMGLTVDELNDLVNAIDIVIGAYSVEDTQRLAHEYRAGSPGHARLVALAGLVGLTEPA